MQGDLDVSIPLSSEAEVDLERWISNLLQVNGNKFSARSPDIIIYSDASRSGWELIQTALGPEDHGPRKT